MSNQILLNFAVPFTEIMGTGEVDTSYLRKAAIVVTPKEGAQTGLSEVVDAARNLQQIQRILQEEQSPESEERLLREFVLQNVRATHVKSQLEQLLGAAEKPAAPLSPEQQMQMQQMEMQMQQARMQQQMQQGKQNMPSPKGEEPVIQIVVNQQRNSVIVQAPPDKMAVIEEAVRLLDVPDRRR